jgi:hypothetical protein
MPPGISPARRYRQIHQIPSVGLGPSTSMENRFLLQSRVLVSDFTETSFHIERATCGQKLKVPYWSSGCLGVQKGSFGGVTGDFEALDNVSNACPVLGRGAGIIELF